MNSTKDNSRDDEGYLKAVEHEKNKMLDWANRVGAKRVSCEQNGNKQVWEYGNSQSKARREFLFGEALADDPDPLGYVSFKAFVTRTKKKCGEILKDVHNINPEAHLPISETRCTTLYSFVTSVKAGSPALKHDDTPALLAHMIQCCDYILDENASEEFRLSQAYLLGETRQRYSYYLSTKRNKENAKSSRDPLANEILKRICKQEKTTRELWEEFKSRLLAEDAEVNTSEDNPKQPKTWKMEYSYICNSGKEVRKKIKYPSFASKVSKLKNS